MKLLQHPTDASTVIMVEASKLGMLPVLKLIAFKTKNVTGAKVAKKVKSKK
jgi:hypothetical protein